MVFWGVLLLILVFVSIKDVHVGIHVYLWHFFVIVDEYLILRLFALWLLLFLFDSLDEFIPISLPS